MRHNFIETAITILVVAFVSVVIWIAILLAVIHVFGCSLSLEVESQMAHHESGANAAAEPTPTPVARGN